jgi:hypothetical protein
MEIDLPPVPTHRIVPERPRIRRLKQSSEPIVDNTVVKTRSPPRAVLFSALVNPCRQRWLAD